MPPVRVKICGLTTPETLASAVSAGASYVGFVHFPKSPRHLDVQRIADLAAGVPAGVAKVLLTVDADNALLDDITGAAGLDILQLQGAESPERVTEVKARYGLPVMKALGVAEESDLGALDTYGAVADLLLVDTKPPKGDGRPGGNGLTFDWRLIAGRRWPVPWMLAGGLTAANVAEALRLTGTRQVDVSSSVEAMPGLKDPALMAEFVTAATA
ncbi:MAG: phosphoribosylanthranilate isomerase [Pseudomonadota bacterium]